MNRHLNYLIYALYNKYMIYTNNFETSVQKRRSYGSHSYLNLQKGNDLIRSRVTSKQPFLVARYGANELAIMRQSEEIKLGFRKHYSDALLELFTNGAGFFPIIENKILEFSDLMYETGKSIDLLGVWYNPMENYFVSKCNPNMKVTSLEALEPWYHNNPWSDKLRGKKVLVIHPFNNTIEKQYNHRNKIFPNGILPEFDLLTIKAVQTIAGNKDIRFIDWFEALEFMYEQTTKLNYDIAILGCGAYGLPLAAKMKNDGKQVIHLGGATQIMFGIKGKRWDNMPAISNMYNEYWVRPSDDDSIINKNSVENGCYW